MTNNLEKLTKSDFKFALDYMASYCRYEVQDELDLGGTWDTRLDKMEKSFRRLIKQALEENGCVIAEDLNA
jgi:hypothetical protein